MKNLKIIATTGILSILSMLIIYSATALPTNSFIVPLCRQFSKDLFDLNAEPFLSPTVNVVNATSNAGFFHSAYIPKKVDKLYFRLSGNFMMGFVPTSMKTFTPLVPAQEYNSLELFKYVEITGLSGANIKDTAGLINYFFQTVLYQGLYLDKTLPIPGESATTLGGSGAEIRLPREVMKELFLNHPLYSMLAAIYPSALDMLDDVVQSIPDVLSMPNGGNIDQIAAGVPQLEIGSLFGTELLIRFVPKINLGQWIGKFSFWGVGVKHSISQYFYDDPNRDGNVDKRGYIAPFDLAAQIVFQGTSLQNTVGVTRAALDANANIFDFNIHFSKNFDNIIEVYSGISYEHINIDGDYTYLLPIELQWQLGLVTEVWAEGDPNEGIRGTGQKVEIPPEFPGDHDPQTSAVNLTENQIKWNLGVCKNIGPVTIFLDYSVSRFNIFSGGIQYRF